MLADSAGISDYDFPGVLNCDEALFAREKSGESRKNSSVFSVSTR